MRRSSWTRAVLLATGLSSHQISPVLAQQLTHIRVFDEHAPELARLWMRDGLDVLEGSVRSRSVELVVDDAETRRLRASGARFDVLALGRPFADLQRESIAPAPEGAVPGGYATLSQIVAAMDASAAAHPTICRRVDLSASFGAPPTWGGRTLQAVVISDDVQQEQDEPAVLIVACYHAREIVTPVIALHAIERLTTSYTTDATVRAAVDAHEIWVVPVCNPDGYEHVFQVDNLWRKNRRDNGGSFGVDLNRNHAFGWSAPCGGSTTSSSQTYRGPTPESEPEVQAILALASSKRFSKVLDYHSSGREVLYAYSCSFHPWAAGFWDAEATALASASGYSTIRPPTAEGEHFEWQLWRGSFAFLIETHDEFQPSFASAQSEAAQVWPGIQWMLARPSALSGHVRDACSAEPLSATITLLGVPMAHGESWSSGGAFGRYDVSAPSGAYQVQISAPGYASAVHSVSLNATSTLSLDVALTPLTTWSSYCTAGTTTHGCTASLSASGQPVAGATSGFVISASAVEGQRTGLVFYGANGAAAIPWAGGSTSFVCVAPPRQRTGVQSSGGTAGACDGTLSIDFSTFASTNPNALGAPFEAGDSFHAQAWFRYPPAAKGTHLSNALAFTLCE